MATPVESELRLQLERNLERIDHQIAAACERSGRSPQDVRLVAVTKYTPIPIARTLLQFRRLPLGESRPQQLIDRIDQIPECKEWHLIGHLQRNKVRGVLPCTALIHSVDSVRLLARIGTIAGELELLPHVLLEVNISGEEAKDGFSPTELIDNWKAVHSQPGVKIQGLMAMAPLTEDKALIRSIFGGLRELRDRLCELTPDLALPELSMGMSHDYPLAVEEGATLIRLGHAVFDGCEDLLS